MSAVTLELTRKMNVACRALELDTAIEQLQEEHLFLKDKLLNFYSQTQMIGADQTVHNWMDKLRDLKMQVLHFRKQLNKHAAWEEKDVFPCVAMYTGREMGVLAVMEQEHELAEQYIQAYLQSMDRAVAPIDYQEAKNMASYLLQAYLILVDHFRKEEEYIFPLAEQMLTEAERFFL